MTNPDPDRRRDDWRAFWRGLIRAAAGSIPAWAAVAVLIWWLANR